MRIEIDTKHDTKDELVHLANMLHAIAGSTPTKSVVVKPKDIRRELRQQKQQRNIFEDPSPSAGFFGMFGDSSETSQSNQNLQTSQPTQVVQTTHPQSAAPTQSADLFSLFGSSGEASTTPSSSVENLIGNSAQDLLNDSSTPEPEPEPKVNIVPY